MSITLEDYNLVVYFAIAKLLNLIYRQIFQIIIRYYMYTHTHSHTHTHTHTHLHCHLHYSQVHQTVILEAAGNDTLLDYNKIYNQLIKYIPLCLVHSQLLSIVHIPFDAHHQKLPLVYPEVCVCVRERVRECTISLCHSQMCTHTHTHTHTCTNPVLPVKHVRVQCSKQLNQRSGSHANTFISIVLITCQVLKQVKVHGKGTSHTHLTNRV